MRSVVSLFLTFIALSLDVQQESRISPDSADPLPKLIQTYCGEKPIAMSFFVQSGDGSQRVISRKELNEDSKIDPNLVLPGEVEPGGQYAVCKNMVLKKLLTRISQR